MDLAILFHNLPLDTDEYPHPAADHFRELEAEDQEVPIRVGVEVARQLRTPGQAQYKVGENGKRIN